MRAHKDTMDLICFISNAFVDLLSDTSNNVCYSNKRRNIIPEHTVRALQEMHLEDYLPFLLSDDQTKTVQEILKAERKKPDGLHVNMKQLQEGNYKEYVVQQMVKRLGNNFHKRPANID